MTMGLVGKWTTVTAAALFVLGLGPSGARAEIVPGNGKADSNCYAELDVSSTTGALITVEKKSTEYSCADGAACDLDGACNNSCTFNIGVCINVPGQEGCTPPGTLESVKAKGKVKGVKGEGGKVVIDASGLLQGSECGAFVDIVIPIKETKKGLKDGKGNVKIDAKAPKGTKPRKDKDKYDMICTPGCSGSASGAFLD
jgi:hypothetical protein